MLKLIYIWRWLGEHRHLRRIRYPWLKLKFGLFWRLCLILVLLSPILIPYCLLWVIAAATTAIVEWSENLFDGQFSWFSTFIGYEQLCAKQKKAIILVHRWRQRFSIYYIKTNKPIKSDYQFIAETIDKLKEEHKD